MFPYRPLANAKPSRSVRPYRLLPLMAGAVALLLTACQPNMVAARKTPLPVDTVIAAKTDYVSKAALTGEIQAQLTTNLAFQVGGQVTERLVSVGDFVHTDQVLARLDPAEQIADRDAAESALAVAQSQLAQAQLTRERQQRLFDQGLATRSAYDGVVEAFTTSQSALESAQATLGSANEALAQTELRAFADGIVTERSIEVGQVVQAGQTSFTVANGGLREAVINVNEGVLTDTFENQSFIVSMSGAPNINAPATLREISPTVDQESGSVKVTLAIQAPPSEMTLGSVVQTTAAYQSVEAIVLPASALTSDNGLPAVWVVAPESNSVSLRKIELSAFDSEALVVASGIEAGERIVTAGASLLYPQQVVSFKE
ncbi:efflux RND transporter periplasmic adaptor subunit [uncultured Devosia sp.]|uniref:efflux RND transporter periplasmic adaptor subunit n=1 Tax=uncultured Devosia sp. TaxID=211434 RepID=UPI0035CA59E0